LSKRLSQGIWLRWMNLSKYIDILVVLSQANGFSALVKEQEGENSEMCLHLIY
jgi:hypothetical protein